MKEVYQEIEMTLKDKFLLLVFNVINRKFLIIDGITKCDTIINTQQSTVKENPPVEEKSESVSIPFFDFSDTVKSNLDQED